MLAEDNEFHLRKAEFARGNRLNFTDHMLNSTLTNSRSHYNISEMKSTKVNIAIFTARFRTFILLTRRLNRMSLHLDSG